MKRKIAMVVSQVRMEDEDELDIIFWQKKLFQIVYRRLLVCEETILHG
ncbi:hypothetical protein [Solitalea lacus]|nr:hypothetical protein [Solitalea lacus]UKJ06579.1 hypothetical protein L2B55_13700 [Solitalea lacus]